MANKQISRERFFAEHEFCCFCGGTEKAVQIEHMPSRIMFRGKQRPKGFEFPICKLCNEVSRQSEPVVAYLAMANNDPEQDGKIAIDLNRQLTSIKRYNPAFVDEILRGGIGNRVKETQIKKSHEVDIRLVSLGTVTQNHMHLFGAKMGMAAFYQYTGKPLSKLGGVSSAFHTALDIAEGKMPEFPDVFGKVETLKQGNWNVSQQFSYRYAITNEQDAAMFQFSFHDNFLITAFIFDDLAETVNTDHNWISPGQLQKVDELGLNPFSKYRSSVSFEI